MSAEQVMQGFFNVMRNPDGSLTYVSPENGKSANMFKSLDHIEISNGIGSILISEATDEDLLSIVQYMTEAESLLSKR